MTEYKGSNHHNNITYALPHIKANNIKCKYYQWHGMALDKDILRIDGKIRYFDTKTHKEIYR